MTLKNAIPQCHACKEPKSSNRTLRVLLEIHKCHAGPVRYVLSDITFDFEVASLLDVHAIAS